ncbi:hypothetical protein K7X08_036427 [Anisodus acutangulus]|uniref:ATP-dependent DNA helicase RecQ zinc-binding domain-containing protein n=1 Tax=Anisodus acutangulus TaxID=402998 RepID=A0A9Q1L602_9SOLA|nr:hypothetical protein K7X08_036427 [Anisodus acutangulus]
MEQARKMQKYCELKTECCRKLLPEHFGDPLTKTPCKNGQLSQVFLVKVLHFVPREGPEYKSQASNAQPPKISVLNMYARMEMVSFKVLSSYGIHGSVLIK